MTGNTPTPSWRNSPGPWKGESDGASWDCYGLRCLMARPVPELGHWCGYVDIPKGHPWFGVCYDNINARLSDTDTPVHGGLTYADEVEGCWRIGFDCAHSCDVVPGLHVNHGVYRTETWVYAEVGRLARAAAKAT